MDFSETIEVKVFDKDHFSMDDSYFFAYFQDLPAALGLIRDAVRTHRSLVSRSPLALLDTTSTRTPHPIATQGMDRTKSLPTPDSRFGSPFRLSSLLRPFQDSLPASLGRMHTAPGGPELTEGPDEYTHITRRSGSSIVPITASSPEPMSPPGSAKTIRAISKPTSTAATPTDHTYPPSTSVGDQDSGASAKSVASSGPWNVGVPSWLKVSRSRATTPTLHASLIRASTSASGIREVYSAPSAGELAARQNSGDTQGDLGYSILETPEAVVDPESAEKFRAAFAFDEKETLMGCMSAPTRSCFALKVFCRFFWIPIPSSTSSWSALCLHELLLFQVKRPSHFQDSGMWFLKSLDLSLIAHFPR